MTLASLNAAAASAIDRYTIIDLGTLGGPKSQGTGINNAGEVTGGSDLSGSAPQAFRYSGG